MQCNQALQVVRNVRAHLKGSIVDEQQTNFTPYKVGKKSSSAFAPAPVKKCTPWFARFVCLANTDDQHVPSSIAHKEVLAEAGLGEKRSLT